MEVDNLMTSLESDESHIPMKTYELFKNFVSLRKVANEKQKKILKKLTF